MNLIAEFIGGPLHGTHRSLPIGSRWFYLREGSVVDGYERDENWYSMLRAYFHWRSHEVLPARAEESELWST